MPDWEKLTEADWLALFQRSATYDGPRKPSGDEGDAVDHQPIVGRLVDLLRESPHGLTYDELWHELSVWLKATNYRWYFYARGLGPKKRATGSLSSTDFTKKRLRHLLDSGRAAGIIKVVVERDRAAYRLLTKG